MNDSLGLGDSYESLGVLSGAPEYMDGKLLGIPSLGDFQGQTQAHATYNLHEVWDAALVFDTTASNGVADNGAAKHIEERLLY